MMVGTAEEAAKYQPSSPLDDFALNLGKRKKCHFWPKSDGKSATFFGPKLGKVPLIRG